MTVAPHNISRPVATYLYIAAASVFIMAIIGAITRLTESGLSIVEWNPVSGAIPPLNDMDWQREFDLYRQSPQYQQVNAGMTMAEFKWIYFWEWIHRQWGRLIGVIYAVPLVYFWRRIPVARRKLFIGVGVLGLAQGFMGWYMVKSGLVDMPAVSHYRLAAHLMLAFLIYACLLRMGLLFSVTPEGGHEKFSVLRPLIYGVMTVAVLTMIWGAFTAGLRAGLLYNTFPKMDAHWFPPETAQFTPVWQAFFAEPATVQFTHRVLALLTAAAAALLVWRGIAMRPSVRLRRGFYAVAAAVAVQVLLGIATLLSHVHIHPATWHQAGAMVLLSTLVWVLHEIPVAKENKDG